jgi:hypothetical protein
VHALSIARWSALVIVPASTPTFAATVAIAANAPSVRGCIDGARDDVSVGIAEALGDGVGDTRAWPARGFGHFWCGRDPELH